jgi:hypothetical protein
MIVFFCFGAIYIGECNAMMMMCVIQQRVRPMHTLCVRRGNNILARTTQNDRLQRKRYGGLF